MSSTPASLAMTTTVAVEDRAQSTPITEAFDMEIANKMHFITSVWIGTIFFILGTLGNILSIVIWLRKPLRSSTGTYLIGLAIADICVLFFFFITDSIKMMHPELEKSHSYAVFFSYIGYPIFYLAVICSIWITVGVTVDRYIQVCWISHSKTLCNQRRALTGLGIISLLCFIINVPHFNTYKPVSDQDRNASDPAMVFTEFGETHGSQMYEFWVHCMFLVLVPVVTIFILNMLIICQVRKVNRQMESKRGESGKTKARKSESQLTRLLLTVTFTFLVLISFQCIVQCFFMLKSGNPRIVSEAYAIAKLGIVINSSINFLLYCVSGKRFRKELLNTVCGKIAGFQFTMSTYSASSSDSHTHHSFVTKTKSAASNTDSVQQNDADKV